MAAPVVTSITPTTGITLGETLVTIVGSGFLLTGVGVVTVKFGTLVATEVKVLTSTLLTCLTPRQEAPDMVGPSGPGTLAVDVEVANVPDPAGPPEPTVTLAAFTYRRPDLSTRRDHTNDSAIICLNRKIVADLRQFVIANIHHEMHPEYASPVSAAAGEEAQATAPAIKLMGPDFQEVRGDYALNGRQEVALAAPGPSPNVAEFDILDEPLTLLVSYDYVGTGRTKGEAFQLWTALQRYFKRTPDIEVFANGVDATAGILRLEMNVIREERGRFRVAVGASRQAIYQFQGSFEIRGLPILNEKLGEGYKLDEDPVLTMEQIP